MMWLSGHTCSTTQHPPASPEVPQQPHHWQRRSVAQRADCVALDLLGDHGQHVDFLHLGIAVHQAREDVVEPACALAAGRALPAALHLVDAEL